MIANTPQAWSSRADTAATSWEACGWSRESQPARLAEMIRMLDPQAGQVILDWGCGDGALVDHLPDRVGYYGYDWAPGMLERARRAHMGVLFFDRPYPNLEVDLIAIVGTYNLPGSKQETWHILRWLWDTYRPDRLAISLYAGADERCLIYTEQETLQALHQLAYKATVSRWRPNDLAGLVCR